MFPEFNGSTTGKKKQKAMGEEAGGKCPKRGAKIGTATLITESNTESECWEGKWEKKVSFSAGPHRNTAAERKL